MRAESVIFGIVWVGGVLAALFLLRRQFGVGPMTMNGEGPRPTFCRKCGTRLASRDAIGDADPKTGARRSWEQLYCPAESWHRTWSYHWVAGWSEDWDV